LNSIRTPATKSNRYKCNLNILQLNSQSIRNKLLKLEHLCKIKDVGVICVSEHWLSKDQTTIFVPDNYVVADMMCRSQSKNGGSAIFSKKDIEFEKINVDKFLSEINCELSCIKLLKENLIILSVYRSPNGDINIFLELFEHAVKYLLRSNVKLIICGDFNIEMLNIENQSSVLFTNLLRSLDMVCANKIPTRNNSCIDNILVNFSSDFYTISILPGCFADHDPLLLNYHFFNNFNENMKTSEHTFFRKQTDIQISSFCECLEAETWDFLYYDRIELDAKESFDEFFNKYLRLWHTCSPLMIKKRKLKDSDKRHKVNWYTDSLKQSRLDMLAYHTMYRNLLQLGSDKAQAAYNMYLILKKNYKKQLISTKKKAYAEYIEKSSNKCKAAWDVITQANNTSTRTQESTLDPNEINDYFLDSVNELGKLVPPTHVNAIELMGTPRNIGLEQFHWDEITPDEVHKVVSKFSNSKTMDYYWISNYILKKTIHLIKVQLSFVFNRCLVTGYFPDQLKISKVTPVYKSGSKDQFQNYRPISIVPIFSKVFESLICSRLNNIFESNNLLTHSQFGFRAGKSTTMAVTKIVNSVIDSLEDRESVSMLLFDLTKAFDFVPFHILLKKLEFYGVSGRSIKLIESYLSNRFQYVSIKGKNSILRAVKTGVPQGSVLGPLLFIIAINDLPLSVSVDSVLYADDTTIYASARDYDYLMESIKNSETSIMNWFTANKLVCNQNKTQSITFSLNRRLETQSVKLLGIHLDSKMNWKEHINSVVRKISRVNFLFWKLKSYVDNECLRLAYFGLFQSHIQYGILLWGHSPHVHSILLMQKRIVRTMAGADLVEHCKPLFISFRICTVINLYIYTVLLYIKANLHFFMTRQVFHNHNTRGKTLLHIPQHRLALTGNSFKINGVKFFNRLPESARSTDFSNFKNKIYSWLVCNPFYSLKEFWETDINVTF
jgi:hypothetical protein